MTTQITSSMIKDSVSVDTGARLTTVLLRYPRFIHAELLTHRVFSRNSASSRAIPVARLIEEAELRPALPLHWGRHEPGMQAYTELEGVELERVQAAYQWAREAAIAQAKVMAANGAAKQLVNRILEPFIHIDVLVTSTEWDNFLFLRLGKSAEPHIQLLAKAIRTSMNRSRPTERRAGEWHLPFTDLRESKEANSGDPELLQHWQRVSAARCARLSYRTADGRRSSTEAEDVALCDKLIQGQHLSPFEHVATPADFNEFCSNFRGWCQYRKQLEQPVPTWDKR